MFNSDPPPSSTDQDQSITHIVAAGPTGAAVLAGITTAIVLAIWVGFYFLVFVPRTTP
jgi:asparagine N-glycosylation enzyme membrane subunit Stt3